MCLRSTSKEPLKTQETSKVAFWRVNVDDDANKQRGAKKKDVFHGAREKDEEANAIYEKFRPIQNSPTMDEATVLIDSLINHFFFSSMEADELDKTMGQFFLCEVDANEYIFKQGDQASCFFIIYSGETVVEINGSEVKRLGPKENFGELALLYNAPRSASIRSLTPCRMFAINRSTFKKIQYELSDKKFKENRAFLEKIPFFESMTSEQKDMIANRLITQSFKPGAVIVNEGDIANSYYIIRKGVAEVVKGNNVLREMKEGESFGEQALIASGNRAVTVRAGANCSCLALSRGDLQECFDESTAIHVVIQANWSRWAIEKDKVFSKLTKLQIEKWIKRAEYKKLEEGDIILEKGKPLSKVIIVINGQLSFGNRNYGKGSVFEANYLYPSNNLNTK